MLADQLTVGNVEIVPLLDVVMDFPWSYPFPDMSPADFEPYRDLYPGSFADGKFRTNAQCYAIRSQGKTILCDTGVGPGPIDWLNGARGGLADDMKNKRISPQSIDLVFHTHLHGDHVGWNMSADKPMFPNAMYHAPKADWDFFGQALAANPQMRQVTPLEKLGRLELFGGEHQLTPEITAIPTPGHTPGHSSLIVSSAGEKALIMGDLAHHPAQIDHSEWPCGFDTDRALGVKTRQRMLDQAESEGVPAVFCHFPAPGMGKIVRLEGKRIFQAL